MRCIQCEFKKEQVAILKYQLSEVKDHTTGNNTSYDQSHQSTPEGTSIIFALFCAPNCKKVMTKNRDKCGTIVIKNGTFKICDLHVNSLLINCSVIVLIKVCRN